MEDKVILSSSDGALFEVEMDVIVQSQTLTKMIEDTGDKGSKEKPIPLEDISGKIYELIVQYGKYYFESQRTDVQMADPQNSNAQMSDASKPAMDLKKFVRELVENDKDTLFQLMIAANYLHIQSLLDISYQIVGEDIAACKDQEEIRQKYGIQNDYTPEEEQQVLKLYNIFEG